MEIRPLKLMGILCNCPTLVEDKHPANHRPTASEWPFESILGG